MEFPKMLYKAEKRFADADALKHGLHSGAVQTLIVESEQEQTNAEGWTDDLSSLIGRNPGRPPKVEA